MNRIAGRAWVGAFFMGLFLISPSINAQETILSSYERNFVRSDVAGKVNVLRDAADDEDAPEFIHILYYRAMFFVRQNADLLRNDPDMIELTLLASRGLGIVGNSAARDNLWEFFTLYDDALLMSLLFSNTAINVPETVSSSYEREFARSNLAGKAGVLRDAAADRDAPEFISAFYLMALQFARQNADLLRSDPDMITMVIQAIRGMGRIDYWAAVDLLWELFTIYDNALVQVEILNSFSVLGQGRPYVIGYINRYLEEQTKLFRSGAAVDYSILSAAISTLAWLGSDTSYGPLFGILTSGYPDSLVWESTTAIDLIEGDYGNFLIGVIRNNPLNEKLAAFRAGAYSNRLSSLHRGQLAEASLEIGLNMVPANKEEERILANLRYLSIPVLQELRWNRATDLVIKYFYQVQGEYEAGNLPVDQLLGAVACLGVMGNTKASQALTLQLGYLNARMKQNEPVEESLVLEMVRALGEIGDKVAADSLAAIEFLPYANSIKFAAKESINRIKW